MKKLSPDSHIRVLSPSDSIARLGGFEANLSAKETLENLGFRVSFSEHYLESDMLDSSSNEVASLIYTLPFWMTLSTPFWLPLVALILMSYYPILTMT